MIIADRVIEPFPSGRRWRIALAGDEIHPSGEDVEVSAAFLMPDGSPRKAVGIGIITELGEHRSLEVIKYRGNLVIGWRVLRCP